MAPVPVTKLVCDGNSYKCTANLVSNPLFDVYLFNWYWHCLSCRTLVMVAGLHSGALPSSTTSTKPRMSSPISQVYSPCVFEMWCCKCARCTTIFLECDTVLNGICLFAFRHWSEKIRNWRMYRSSWKQFQVGQHSIIKPSSVLRILRWGSTKEGKVLATIFSKCASRQIHKPVLGSIDLRGARSCHQPHLWWQYL